MKKVLTLLLISFVFFSLQAQDPYSRLKIAAQRTPVEKEQLSNVKIQRTSPKWRAMRQNPINFVPFELKDKSGNPVPPGKPVTLRNGKIITAQEYINKLNQIEQQLNQQGASLRGNKPVLVSKTITPENTIDGRVATAAESIAPLKTEAQVKAYMNPEKKVGSITFKPLDAYNKQEADNLKGYTFSIDKGKNLKVTTTTKAKRFNGPDIVMWGNPKSLHTTEITNNKKWSFGDPETFAAGIEGTLYRYAKIYPFNPNHPEKSMSEFKASAKGKVWGSLFGNSFDLLNGVAEFNAPADTAKKMSAKLNIKAAGITLYNFSREYRQSASFSDFYGKEFDKSFPIEVPIGYGFDFKGKIGAKGRIGFEYGGAIYRTFVSVQGKPVAEVEGYAEAGIEFLDVIGAGVGGKLTFLKGNLSLDAFAGVWAQDAEQIVLAISYHFGYDLEMLSGSLYCYVEVCAPDWLGGGCWRPIEHELYKWNGFKRTGTIAEGTHSYVLANVWERGIPPVLTQ